MSDVLFPVETPIEPTPRERNPWVSNGGVIILGSLWWQDDLDPGDLIRRRWRDSFLGMEAAIKIHFPMDYGRLSTKNKPEIYTMSSLPSYKLGHAYLVPFQKSIGGVYDLKAEAEELAKAEGILKEPGGALMLKWACVCVAFPSKLSSNSSTNLRTPAGLQTEVATEWAKMIRQRPPIAKRVGDLDYWSTFWEGVPRPDRAFDSGGRLVASTVDKEKWLRAVDPKDQNRLDKIDFALCTVVKPDSVLPSNEQLANNVKADLNRQYFYNNHHSGITTYRDEEIIRRATPTVKQSSLKLKREQSLFSPLLHTRLKFDGRRLVLTHDGKHIWQSDTHNSGQKPSNPFLKEDTSVVSYAYYQDDGNLVLYKLTLPDKEKDGENQPYWSTHTFPKNGSRSNFILLDEEPRFQIGFEGRRIWTSDLDIERPFSKGLQLWKGGQRIRFAHSDTELLFNGKYLIFRHIDKEEPKRIIWISTPDTMDDKISKLPNTDEDQNHAEFQARDGNLVLYNVTPPSIGYTHPDNAYWATRTNDPENVHRYRLDVSNNGGNLRLELVVGEWNSERLWPSNKVWVMGYLEPLDL